mmetsp:Transcript_120626/g.257627  ORF Transcript_120626/g.257627 Transcript_120626/m.257627 type:complete len:200 (+) Transcript_120626:748-1347(+)
MVVSCQGVEGVHLGSLIRQHHDLVQSHVEGDVSMSGSPGEGLLQPESAAPCPVPQQQQHQILHLCCSGLWPQGRTTPAQGLLGQGRLLEVLHRAHQGWRPLTLLSLFHLAHRLDEVARQLQRQNYVLALGCHGLSGGAHAVAHARCTQKTLAAARPAQRLHFAVGYGGAESLHSAERGVQLREAIRSCLVAIHDASAHL